jgi:hypothetical protein
MTWQRVEPLDEYDDVDGRRAVLVNDQVVVVSPLAAAILDTLPAGEGALGARLVELFGPPPGGLDRAVSAALQGLENAGLVNKSPTRR